MAKANRQLEARIERVEKELPGLPNLRITREGVESLDGKGLDEGTGQMNLHIAITRDDLL